jgi:hypothetical protein
MKISQSGFFLLVFFFYLSDGLIASRVFINGQEVTGTTNQILKDVAFSIDDKGDIYVLAPHYEVKVEDTYTPLVPGIPKTPELEVPVKAPEAPPTAKPLPETPPAPVADKKEEPLVPEKPATPLPPEDQKKEEPQVPEKPATPLLEKTEDNKKN